MRVDWCVSSWFRIKYTHSLTQRRYSATIHHSAWREMHAAAGRAGRREQVRFVSASQFGAGAFLNAIPTRAHFRLPSYVLRFALQRRFGLHLS